MTEDTRWPLTRRIERILASPALGVSTYGLRDAVLELAKAVDTINAEDSPDE